MAEFDALVVGAGPNGLAAAIELARAGWSVRVYEARNTVGGGARTAELTLPGFRHDICSAIHPLGLGSPLMRQLPLAEYGLEWIHPDIPLAHPLDDGQAVALYHSLEDTAAALGRDGTNYRRLIRPIGERWHDLAVDILGPFKVPQHPLLLARFGLSALPSAKTLSRLLFRTQEAQALLAGNAAHSLMPLENLLTASFGVVLAALGHAVGWPVAKGGSQGIVDAMAAYLKSLGGEIVTGHPVEHIDALPSARAVLFDTSPKQLLQIAASRFPHRYQRALERYRHNPGVFKVDFALDGPIPWRAAACRRAGTVHVGGTLEEIAVSESAVWYGRHSDRPFVLVAQQSLFDDTRSPQGKHTCWAYCHVPHGSTVDMTERIEAQIERFAPGFRDLILARHRMNTAEVERYNPNYIGGDITGGVQDLWQLWTRPTIQRVPYATAAEGIYLCSASTPPGGGVHGMCGYHAARAVLRDYPD